MPTKQPMPPVPPLQPLLFWETGVLLFAAGIVAARFPVPALTACALFVWADSRTRRPLCCLLAAACVIAGWWIGGKSAPRVPQEYPAWLEKSLSSRRAVTVEGVIVGSRGLPDQRLQIILDDVGPAEKEPLPGRLALTWQDMPDVPRPLPGQRITANLKIRPVHGFRNQGAWNSEDYWHRQGVFFQAWAKQDDAAIRTSGTPSAGAGLRERLRLRVAAALGSPEESGPRTLSPSSADGNTSRRSALPPPAAWNELPPAPREENLPSAPERVGAVRIGEVRNHSGSPAHSAAPADTRPFSRMRDGGSSIIPALLFGDRYGLNTPDMERINAAGLTHSLALSGQHLAVVGLGALALTGMVGLLAPGLFLRFPAYSLIGLLSLPLAYAYLWLGDAPPSLVRAALMLTIVCLLRCVPDLLPERFRRNLRPAFTFADVLLLALLCMVLADPLCLYDLGVQLSFSAVAGIALCSPWLSKLWNDGPFSFSPLKALQGGISPMRAAMSRFVRLLWLTLGCSVAAQLATLPLVLDAFGRSTLWFPINLLWLPALGFIVLPLSFLGLIAAAAGLEQAAAFLLHLANIPCEALLYGLRWLQAHAGLDLFVSPRPHWTAILGFGAAAVALAMRVHRDHFPHAAKRLLISGALLLSIGPLLWIHAFFEPKISLRVLDVGQGQALLLEWPCGGRALVDGGGLFSDRFDVGRDIVSPVLTANNLPRLDFIAVTHPDRDHLKGLLFIADNYAIKKAYTAPLEGIDTPRQGSPRPLSEAFAAILASRGIPRHTLRAGNVLPLADGLALEVLAPAPGVTPSGNNGLVFRLALNGHGLALLPGDAEAPYLRALLRSGADLSADVLVLPHHGSAGSRVPALYDAVSPKLAIASAGAYNPYRLPSRKVRDALEWRDIPLYITGDEGEIAVHWALKKNVGKNPTLQEGFPPQPRLSLYGQPLERAKALPPEIRNGGSIPLP